MRFRLFLFCLISTFVSLSAQLPELRVRYFSRTDGLMSAYVNHVTQDSTGYIWIATREGLYRYDGYSFSVYLSKTDDSTTTPGNVINYLFVDSKDRLWVATNAGICYFNKETYSFIRIAEQKNPAGLASLNISKILEDNSGNILVNDGNSIYSFNEKSRVFSLIKNIPYTLINDFLVDSKNNIWIGLDNNEGLIRLDPVKQTELRFMDNVTISHIVIKDDVIWIATLGQGIKSIKIQNRKTTDYPFNNSDDAMAVNIITDRHGNIWTVDYTGLKIALPASVSLAAYYPEGGNPFSIRANVKGIFEDNQGNYWIYHEPGGLGLSMKMKGFKHFDSTDPIWHTASSNITAIQEDATKNLWMGFHEGGIDVFDWQNGTISHYSHDEKNRYSLGRGSILCLFLDHQGVMWVGTYFDGLQYFDEKNKRFVSVPHDPDNPNSPAGNDIRSIVEDSEGNLWLAVHSKGVDKFDRKNNIFEHFNNKSNQLTNDWPFQLSIDQKGNVWVATAWGLNMLKKGSRKFQNFISAPDDSTSLTSNFITSVHADKRNNIWVGTSDGLNLYDSINGRFTRYKNVLQSNFISSIECDKNGNVWVGTLSGISRIGSDNRIINFDVTDGLASSEFNARAVYKSWRDEMFFGGTKGIDIFQPDKLELNTTPPPVVITKLLIYNKEITPQNSGALDRHISTASMIRLQHTDKVITFNFVSLNYINSHKNQFAYRLEGFEKEWHFVGKSREATYTNIDPGKYTFKVIASNNDGLWNTNGAKVQITVLPPWYGTLAFKIISLLLTAILIWLFIKYRTANLEKKRILLEKTVEEKTASLLEANHELQKYNHTKDKLFSLISHDLVSPFNTIIGFSEVLKEGYDHLNETEKKNYIGMINESSEKVYVLLNNLLVWSRSQTNRITYNPGAVRLKTLIDEVLELNSERLKVKNIRVKVDCPTDLQVIADLEMLKTIIRNLFSNALKFTLRSGNIFISVKPDSTKVNVSVIDTGIGMSPEKIDELLSETLVESETGTEGESGTGFGLTICKDFIKRNNGELHITSEPGKGSKFTFSLPLASN